MNTDSESHRAICREVLAGLTACPRKLNPKFLYDANGAMLFEQITTLPEYYPTSTELGILEEHVATIAELAGPGAILIEYGSGAGVKVRLLLDAFDQPAAYIPIDISGEQLTRVAGELSADYPDVQIVPIRGDYTKRLDIPDIRDGHRHVAFFPGSTIGNFEPHAAIDFLTALRQTISDTGLLILGVDRVKDAAVLEAAYDDSAGVTAKFNRNMLTHINNMLDADFDPRQFAHRAIWNADASRIEMHLVSSREQQVHISGETIRFRAGESIWTESSYKYDRHMLDDLVCKSGFEIGRLWSDEDELFWVALLK